MEAEAAALSQEPAAEPSCSLGHLFSSRKLLAVGAVLGWLLVIHLLVNVWLLCLLSALLLVLGGWLGSDAIVGASGRLHLERFIPLAICPPNPEAERQLEQEIDRTIRLIMRDFVSSWYRTVSQEPAFEEEMEAAMRGLVQELRRRMAMVDRHALAQRVLTLCGCHLQSYIQAKEATAGKQSGTVEPSQLWEAYCRTTAPHPAVQSPSTEVTYTREIVDLLLKGLVPKPHLETRTGRHVVVELITCNVILPLISKLSDPDWIHLVLVGIFSKARNNPAGTMKPLCQASTLEQPSVPTSLPLIVEVQSLPKVRAPSPAAVPVLLDCSEPDGPSHLSPEVEEGREALEGDLGVVLEERRVGNNPSHFLQPGITGPLFLSEDAELESPLSELGKETIMLMTPGNFLSDKIPNVLCVLGGSHSLEAKDAEGSEGVEEAEAEEGPGTETDSGLLVSMLNTCPEIHIDTADKEVEQGDVTSLATLLASPERTCPPRPPCLEKELTNGVSALDPSLPQVLLSSSPPGPLSAATFSFEPLSSPDGPVVIQNLRITGTITAREHSGTGFHPYTLYTVKYETALEGESTKMLGDELCQVCGDTASGFHYNVLSCEGCKGFFRRSVIRGGAGRYACRGGGTCQMDAFMRRKCQQCRLRKCKEAGMREQCVLSKEQIRKKKIRKQQQQQQQSSPTAPGVSSGSASGPGASPGGSDGGGQGSGEGEGIQLTAAQELMIQQLVAAQLQCNKRSFSDQPKVTPWPLGADPQSRDARQQRFAHFTELAIISVQEIVDFAKQVPGFLQLGREDQIALLKASTIEIMLLETARRYNHETECITFLKDFTYSKDDFHRAGLQVEFINPIFEFSRAMRRLGLDDAEYALLIAINIFSADRPNVQEPSRVEALQQPYVDALLSYTRIKRPQDQLRFPRMLMKLVSLRTLSSVHSEQVFALRLQDKKLPPLLSEIWDVHE